MSPQQESTYLRKISITISMPVGHLNWAQGGLRGLVASAVLWGPALRRVTLTKFSLVWLPSCNYY